MPLLQRNATGGESDGQQRERSTEEDTQPPVGPALPLRLARRSRPALVEELTLELVQRQRVIVRFGPVERGAEPSRPVELGGVATRAGPVQRRLRHVAMQAPPFGILGEPLAESWPVPEQRFVRHLDLAVARRQEASGGERIHNGRHALVVAQVEFRDGHATARDGLAASSRGEPEHQPARDPLPVFIQGGIGGLGVRCDGSLHAAHALVRLELQRAVLPLLPQIEQRGREQRQPSGLADDVGDERLGQCGLDDEIGAFRRPFDHATQLAAGHRPEQDVVGAGQLCELRELGQPPEEVGAQSKQDEATPLGIPGRLHECVDERVPFRVVRGRP